MSAMQGQGDSAGAEDRAEVVRRELLLLDPEVRVDRHRVRALLHPDFAEFGASGRIWDAEATIEALAADSAPCGHEVSDLAPASLSDDTVLLTYRVNDPGRPRLRSSVWLRSAEGEWLLRFHQGTPVPSQT
jgi:ribonuclease HI